MTPENKASIESYNRSAAKLSQLYNGLSIAAVLPWFEENLPGSTPENRLSALDLGCGSGRDAYWLADEKNFSVVAMDAAKGMIREAQEKKSHPHVTYIVDELPAMGNVKALGRKFDVILLSAVWMHLNEQERIGMVGNIASISNPGSLAYISLRNGPSPADRPMFPVSIDELGRLAAAHGARADYLGEIEDKQDRDQVFWQYVALRF